MQVFGDKVLVKDSKEGYSSIHLVARLSKPVHCLDCRVPNFYLPIEVQIRTVFEDAWGEIDHKYGYVVRAGKETGQPIKNPEFVLTHLKVLKQFTDACMDYAETIKDEATKLPRAEMTVTSVISVDADDDLVERFYQLEVPKEFIAAYENGRTIKANAAEVRVINKARSNELYLTSAELFRELGEEVEANTASGMTELASGLMYYYARMNEAVSLMSINEEDYVRSALSIYERLEDKYRHFPLLQLRLGQARGKLGYTDESIDNLLEAGRLMQHYKTAQETSFEQAYPNEMPYVDYKHLVVLQPKLLGYHYWLKIQQLPPDKIQEKIDLYIKAYEITLKSLDAIDENKDETSSIVNNLLYYCVGIVSHSTQIDNTDELQEAYLLKLYKHLNDFEELNGNLEAVHIRELDTLAKAYYLCDRKAEAIRCATALTERCLTGDDDETEDRIKLRFLRTANQIISGENANFID